MTLRGKVFKYGENVDTDAVIPARYLNVSEPDQLAAHCMEDIDLDFVNKVKPGDIIMATTNFGCGSSREHAVWAFAVNDINIVIAESFARIFRQNMFNCGILAIELPKTDIERLFAMKGDLTIAVDLDKTEMTAHSEDSGQPPFTCSFQLNPFDRDLVAAGGWLAYADKKF